MTIFLIGAILVLGIAAPLFYLSRLHKERLRQYSHKQGWTFCREYMRHMGRAKK